MNYLNIIANLPQVKGFMSKATEKLTTRTKRGSDEIVMKVGFIAVALSIFTLWKTGVLQLVSDWISNMQTQSANFWT